MVTVGASIQFFHHLISVGDRPMRVPLKISEWLTQ